MKRGQPGVHRRSAISGGTGDTTNGIVRRHAAAAQWSAREQHNCLTTRRGNCLIRCRTGTTVNESLSTTY